MRISFRKINIYYYEVIFGKENKQMNETNRELLDQVINQNLSNALNAGEGSEEAKAYFRQAMDAIDRQINLNKVDCAYQESYDKLEAEKSRIDEIEKEKIAIEKQKLEIEERKIEIENEKSEIDKQNREQDEKFKAEEARNNLILRGVEIACGVIVTPIISYALNRGLSKVIMRWEEGNTFTTTPGKSLRGMFQFKK